MQQIYYNGESSYSTIFKKYIERHTYSLQNEPRCRIVVVLDDALVDDIVEEGDEGANGTGQGAELPRGRVIAAIKYYLVPGEGPHPDTRTQDIIDTPEQSVHGSSYENEALSNAFVGPMVAAHKHAMNAQGPHW